MREVMLFLITCAEHGGWMLQAGASAVAIGPAVDGGGLELVAVSGASGPSLWAPLSSGLRCGFR
jgi:hypothetical protein